MLKDDSEASIELLADPERRKKMGQQARQHARRDFCSSKIVKHYEELYRQDYRFCLITPDIA
jgi:hypothetical protein